MREASAHSEARVAVFVDTAAPAGHRAGLTLEGQNVTAHVGPNAEPDFAGYRVTVNGEVA